VIVHQTPADDDDGSKEGGMPTTARPSSQPMFTGFLELHLMGGMKPIARRLLSLPGGIHFRKLTLTWFCEEDLLMVKALVEECSHTLESLNVTWGHHSKTIQRQCLHRQLTSVFRYAGVSFDRPLENDKTQRCGVSVGRAERRMGHHGTPNHLTQTSRSSTDHDQGVPPLHPPQCRCHWGHCAWAVVGPRSPVGPILGIALDSPEGRVLNGAKQERLRWVFIARDHEERVN
jgi:hypothetical protein